MYRKFSLPGPAAHLLLIFIMGCLLTACITEDLPDNSRRGNFEALWTALDRRYCFFEHKQQEYGLDWNEVYERYAPAVNEQMTDRQLFEVLANVTYELRDGHVNLYAAHDVARYGAWFDNYPANYADTLERIYLGRSEDYEMAAGLKYKILDDNIGYVRCSTFENGFGSGNLHEMLRTLAACSGLIVDVRNNGGGLLTAAEMLASLFTNETYTAGYICHKTGYAHDAFSALQPLRIAPFEGLRWQKPVAILTNRRTFSAANAFVMYLKGRPNVCIVGDRTGGGSGLPFTTELPNGWTLRFSACPMYDAQKQPTEAGIDPDLKTDITSDDLARGIDTIIEAARRQLHGLTGTTASRPVGPSAQE